MNSVRKMKSKFVSCFVLSLALLPLVSRCQDLESLEDLPVTEDLIEELKLDDEDSFSTGKIKLDDEDTFSTGKIKLDDDDTFSTGKIKLDDDDTFSTGKIKLDDKDSFTTGKINLDNEEFFTTYKINLDDEDPFTTWRSKLDDDEDFFTTYKINLDDEEDSFTTWKITERLKDYTNRADSDAAFLSELDSVSDQIIKGDYEKNVYGDSERLSDQLKDRTHVKYISDSDSGTDQSEYELKDTSSVSPDDYSDVAKSSNKNKSEETGEKSKLRNAQESEKGVKKNKKMISKALQMDKSDGNRVTAAVYLTGALALLTAVTYVLDCNYL